MASLFEDPRKTAMREPCKAAIDRAGHHIRDEPQAILAPDDAEVEGAIQGDLQSVDAQEIVHCYYLRPEAPTSVPHWLAGIARAAQLRGDAMVHFVVEISNDEIEESCRRLGIGLLVLQEDFSFDQRAAFSFTPDAHEDDEHRKAIAEVRQELVSTLDLRRSSIESEYSEVRRIISSFPVGEQEQFEEDLASKRKRLDQWEIEMSQELDVLNEAFDKQQLEELRLRIARGPN
jgi:hypothetical protein